MDAQTVSKGSSAYAKHWRDLSFDVNWESLKVVYALWRLKLSKSYYFSFTPAVQNKKKCNFPFMLIPISKFPF